MAGVFFRLKLALIRNGLRGSPLRVAGFAVVAAWAGAVALLGFSLLAHPPADPPNRADLPVAAFALVFLGWVVLPVIGYGLDETLDPSRLALLPLRRRQLMTGLVVASSVGVAPVATLLGLSGAVPGYGRGLGGRAVVAAAVAVEFALCVTGARAVTTALSRALRSRKGRDTWLVALPLFLLVSSLLALAARPLGPRASNQAVAELVAVLRWLPPGFAGHAAHLAEQGRLGAALRDLVVPAAAALGLVLLWMRNLERLAHSSEPVAHRRGSTLEARPDTVLGLFPARWPFPRDRRGAVAVKDLRYLWREPMLRAQRGMTLIFAVGAVASVALVPRLQGPEAVLNAAAFAWLFSLNAVNQFAADRAAYWMHAAAPGDPRADLLGKNLAGVLLYGALFLVVAPAIAALSGGWAYLPLAVCLVVGLFGISFGVGNVASVRLPIPMPDSSTNLWASRGDQGCGTGLVMQLVFVLNVALAAPVGALVFAGVRFWRPLLWVAAAFALAYGLLVYRAGLGLAAAWLRDHQPELLENLSPRQAA